MDLDSVASELYGLRLADFTAARDARAAEARRAGNVQLGAAVKKLRRPSAAAWLANMLTRQRPAAVDDLLRIGIRLREAQERFSGPELKELAKQGHQIVAGLVADAERLATSGGSGPSRLALRQLQETLDAALLDRVAAEALRGGRLTVALSYAGLGDIATRAGHEAGMPEAPTETTQAETEQARRERALAELSNAEARVAELTAELQSAQRRYGRMQEQIDTVERQLQQARAQESQAARQIEDLQIALGTASRDAADARQRITGRG